MAYRTSPEGAAPRIEVVRMRAMWLVHIIVLVTSRAGFLTRRVGSATPGAHQHPKWNMAGEVCKPNISVAGRRRRIIVGRVALVLGAALFAAGIAFHLSWYLRALVFLPAALSATGFLQATRHTCIARANEGTFEHDDFSTTKAAPAEVAASRAVATTIKRDAVLIGVACATLAVASAFVL